MELLSLMSMSIVKVLLEPLSLETLHHKVTEADIETRIPVLFEYFIPENFIPLEKTFTSF